MMLQLTEAELEALDAAEVREFLDAMTDTYIADRPGEAPTRAVVRERMRVAYDWALDIGFTDGPYISRFMRFICDGPSLLRDKQLDAYLRKPGATPEQRFDDLLAVIKNRLERSD